jgi:tetratricopeptide (TPR) repeat protein
MNRPKVAGIVAISAWLSLAQTVSADGAGTQNRTGNQLFEQGKYQEAEKAYLEAQADMPGRPELSYNLGNALIKQKKYDQALQSLRQAIAQGNKGLQASSWYNAGNALFELGSFQDSAQAYIQALRLNPHDRDAKHNLELALRRMEEQKQKQPDQQEQKQPNPDGSGRNQGQDTSKQPEQQEPQPANPKSSPSDRREGGFSRERALQILDALQNQELTDQRRLLERQARRKATGRDW